MILPMFRSPFAVALWVVALTSPLQAMRADAFACTQSEVSLTYVRYEFAVQKDAQGITRSWTGSDSVRHRKGW